MVKPIWLKLRAWNVKSKIAIFCGLAVGAALSLMALAGLVSLLTRSQVLALVSLVIPLLCLLFVAGVMLSHATDWARTKSWPGVFRIGCVVALVTALSPFIMPFLILQVLGSSREESLTANLVELLQRWAGTTKF